MKVEVSKKLADEIRIFAHRKQTPLRLSELYEFGSIHTDANRLRAAQFIHNELPIRLAHMIRDIEVLPFGLNETGPVRAIHALYVRAFEDILAFPHPRTLEDEARFTAMLDELKTRHRNVVMTMALGVQELKNKTGEENIGDEIQTFLDRFYMSRIGIRMLIGQHIALGDPEHRKPGWVGIICAHTSPREVALDAGQHATRLCMLNYGVAPEIEFAGRVDLTFTYIPTHLHHMFFELLKNSLRATVESHGVRARKKKLPPVKIVIADGVEDVTIKIEDEGGGLPRSGIERVWTYLYTTAKPPAGQNGGLDVDPIAGFGFGLPITRLYARYFGGDLQLISMEGYGTDAYLHLNRLGTSAEVLP